MTEDWCKNHETQLVLLLSLNYNDSSICEFVLVRSILILSCILAHDFELCYSLYIKLTVNINWPSLVFTPSFLG